LDLRTQRNALILLLRAFDRRKRTVPHLKQIPQKPAFGSADPIVQAFPRTAPEEQGLSSDHLADFIDDLQNDSSLEPHAIMILRNGSVIAEGNFGSYDKNIWHITHSECKSITSLAIGMLIDEGRISLDDKMSSFFDKHGPVSLSQLTHKSITIKHLLTMTSGIIFNEAGAVTDIDWVKCFLQSNLRSDPGNQFYYNSMNTYMLSAIVRQVTGQSLTDYLKPRLFEPLGITKIFWETCPKGIEKGGWGLYIRMEDLAKIGQLILQKGNWNGVSLISQQYIEEATSLQVKAPEEYGNYNYGYQIWVGRKTKSFLFNGMFGQNLIGFPETNVLILSNAGNDEMFQQSSFYKLIDKYFNKSLRPKEERKKNALAHRRLQSILNNLRTDGFSQKIKERSFLSNLFSFQEKDTTNDLCKMLDGNRYVADVSETYSLGLLPVFVQLVQNIYTKGLKSISFSFKNDDFCLNIEEEDETFCLPIGFSKTRTSDIIIHGEPHKVGVLGHFTTDEDETPVLKLKISFLEISNSRIIKIFFFTDKIVTEWSENPGIQFVNDALLVFKRELKNKPIFESMLSKTDTDFIKYKVDTIIEPKVTLKLAHKEKA